MTDTKHTPTPWVSVGGCIETVDDTLNDGFYIATVYGADYAANAAHIVKCVNMHDELVATIKELLKVYNEPDESICCNGRDCGCQGASVRQQAEHYASETLKKAGAL